MDVALDACRGPCVHGLQILRRGCAERPTPREIERVACPKHAPPTHESASLFAFVDSAAYRNVFVRGETFRKVYDMAFFQVTSWGSEPPESIE